MEEKQRVLYFFLFIYKCGDRQIDLLLHIFDELKVEKKRNERRIQTIVYDLLLKVTKN